MKSHNNIIQLQNRAYEIYDILSKGYPYSSVVSEIEVQTLMDSLAPFYLRNKYYKKHELLSVYQKVNDFYARMNTYEAEVVLSDSDSIGRTIELLPGIEAAIPAGQFYCDMYNPVNRRFMAFVEMMKGHISEYDFCRRDLPDYDFLTVVVLSFDEWKPGKNKTEELRIAAKKRYFNDITQLTLPQRFNSILFPVASIKLTSGLEERANTISDFMENNSLAVCLGNPIPLWLWPQIPSLIYPRDYQILNCIRDFQIGLQRMLNPSKDIDQKIPQEFQVNYLLYQLIENQLTDEDILTKVYNAVSGSMPGRPRHDASIGLVNFSKKIWKTTLKIAEEKELIEKNGHKLYRITNKGQGRLRQVIQERETLEKLIIS